MRERKRKKNVLLTVTAVAATAAVALWQFYLFVTFKTAAGAIDPQGGRNHLWWAIGFALIAFISAFFLASFFLGQDGSEELHITAPPARSQQIL
jgi:flagellar basal body-associated protein FliL